MSVTQIDTLLKESSIPIDGVSQLGEDEYRIDFKEEATQEQRQQAESILNNFLANPTQPTSKQWDELAGALYGTNLYQVRLREATANASPEYCDALWWVADDLKLILTAWKSTEEARVNYLGVTTVKLFTTLNDAGFPASEVDRTQVIEILNQTGFAEIATLIPITQPTSNTP